MRSGWMRMALIALVACSAAWLHFEQPSQPPELLGIWERVDLDDPSLVRYYYFGAKGIGLYRYGKHTLNHTEIFEWQVRRGSLHLRFTKSDRRVASRFRIERADGGRRLRLLRDPRENGREVAYRLRPAPSRMQVPADGHPFARTWIRHVPQGFRMYQFQPPDGAGRGRGWFHVGDFDEWTTESLSYRRAEDRLELRFDLTQEQASTQAVERKRAKKRTLYLERDPRNYWHHQVLMDAGPSFMEEDGARLRLLQQLSSSP